MGQPAAGWSLKDAQGRVHSLADLRGKVVLLDFWAEWCGPCKDVIPAMQALHGRYGPKELVVFGIDCPSGEPGETERATTYVAQKRYTYTVLFEGGPVATAYNAEVLPTLYVIDREGTIAYRRAGTGQGAADPIEYAQASEAEIAAVVEGLLN